MNTLAWITLLVVAAIPVANAESTGESAPDPVTAASYFAEARALADRDAGRLWGVRLDGPMLFVDPATRHAVANQADAQGRLTSNGSVHSGRIDDTVAVANTAVTWAGVQWTMILWPLPQDPTDRAELMAHEMFHRVQVSLGLPMANPINAHLDRLEGRYLLQLEWRALRVALTSSPRARDRAIADAIAFREHRRSRFAGSVVDENDLECNEGLAEYTGCVVGNTTREGRCAAAVRGLDEGPTRPSLTRSFAYASGPAYGVLLDDLDPSWRERIASGRDLGAMLGRASRVPTRTHSNATIERLAARYDGAVLLASERARDDSRRARIAADRARFVDGPVLTLPLRSPNVSFDPNTLAPLDGVGTVYGTLRVADAWGTLETTRGALMAANWSSVTVALSADRSLPSLAGSTMTGDGWRLELSPGWSIAAAGKSGSFTVTLDSSPQSTSPSP